MSLVLTQMC